MIKKVFLVLIISLINLPLALAENCPLAGTWKSNEEKTLENMKKANLTEKQIKVFTNNFFGKLVIEYNCESFTYFYEGERKTISNSKVEINGNVVTSSYYDESYGAVIDQTAILDDDGNCYSVLLEGLGFSEVFCKVEEK